MYITLLMNSLVAFSLLSFVGVTLVVDASVFGLADEPADTPNSQAAVEYFEHQMYGILFCFVYVIANSVSKGFESHFSRPHSHRLVPEPVAVVLLP